MQQLLQDYNTLAPLERIVKKYGASFVTTATHDTYTSR